MLDEQLNSELFDPEEIDERTFLDPNTRHTKKDRPEPTSTLPTGRYKEWNCGWENMGTKHLRASDVYQDLGESWDEFIDEFYQHNEKEWKWSKPVFQLKVSPKPGTGIIRPSKTDLEQHKRADRTLFEVMRVNRLVPKVMRKEFIGWGRVGRDYYKVYKTYVEFIPFITDRELAKDQYPNYSLVKHMLKEYFLSTTGRAKEDKTFEKVAGELPLVYIDLPTRLKEVVIDIDIKGTLCEIFNALADQTNSTWEWSGRRYVPGSGFYGKIYFTPKPAAKKSQPKQSGESGIVPALEWYLGFGLMQREEFGYFASDQVCKRIKQSQGWANFATAIQDRVSEEWVSRANSLVLEFQFSNSSDRSSRNSVISEPANFRRVDQMLLETARLNRLVPRKITKRYIASALSHRGPGEKTYPYRFVRVYDTHIIFYPQYTDEVVESSEYPQYEALNALIQTCPVDRIIELGDTTLDKVIELLPSIRVELPSRLHGKPVRFTQRELPSSTSIADLLSILCEKTDSVWEWKKQVLTLDGPHPQIYLAPNPEPAKLVPRPTTIRGETSSHWSLGLEDMSTKQFDYYEVERVNSEFKNEGLNFLSEEVENLLSDRWGTHRHVFELTFDVNEQDTDLSLTNLVEPRNFRRVDQFLLEIARLNRLVPRSISKEELGYGRVGRKLYKVYKTRLQFSPQYAEETMEAADYPDYPLVINMAQNLKLNLDEEPFENVLARLESLSIELPTRLRQAPITLSFEGTLCELLNELAIQTSSIWEWSGRTQKGDDTVASIYFSPLAEPRLEVPLASSALGSGETLNWHLGWENIRSERFGYSEVHSVAKDFARRGWLDLIHEIYDEISVSWDRLTERQCFDLNFYFNYPVGQVNSVNTLSEPCNFRRVDHFILEMARINALVPKTVTKEFVGMGSTGRQRYRVYKTKIDFHMHLDRAVLSSDNYPNYEIIYQLLQNHSIDTLQRPPENKTLKFLVEEISPLIIIRPPPLLENLVVDIKIGVESEKTLCDVVTELAKLINTEWEWIGRHEVEGGAEIPKIRLIPKEDLVDNCVFCDDLS